jgi:hypothetical protein
MTKQILKKLEQVRQDIERERPLTLFALIQVGEDDMGLWDIVVASDWITSGTLTETQYVIEKMRKRLTVAERQQIDKIFLLNSRDSRALELLQAKRQGLLKTYFSDSPLLYRGYLGSPRWGPEFW